MCARRSERGAVCIYSPGAADDRESQGEASPDGEPSLGGISLVFDYNARPYKSHYDVHPVLEP